MAVSWWSCMERPTDSTEHREPASWSSLSHPLSYSIFSSFLFPESRPASESPFLLEMYTPPRSAEASISFLLKPRPHWPHVTTDSSPPCWQPAWLLETPLGEENECKQTDIGAGEKKESKKKKVRFHFESLIQHRNMFLASKTQQNGFP